MEKGHERIIPFKKHELSDSDKDAIATAKEGLPKVLSEIDDLQERLSVAADQCTEILSADEAIIDTGFQPRKENGSTQNPSNVISLADKLVTKPQRLADDTTMNLQEVQKELFVQIVNVDTRLRTLKAAMRHNDPAQASREFNEQVRSAVNVLRLLTINLIAAHNHIRSASQLGYSYNHDPEHRFDIREASKNPDPPANEDDQPMNLAFKGAHLTSYTPQNRPNAWYRDMLSTINMAHVAVNNAERTLLQFDRSLARV